MTIRDRILEHLKSDWLTTTLGVVTAVVVVVVMVLAIAFGPDILSSTNAVRESTDLTGCRSSYNAEVVDRRTDFDIARSERDTADSEADLVLLELAQAALFGDETRVAELEQQLPALRQAVRDANQVVKTAESALTAANADYQDAVELSRTDPAEFLATCTKENL